MSTSATEAGDLSGVTSPATSQESLPASILEASSGSLDDFLADLGLDTTKLTPEQVFIRRTIEENTNNLFNIELDVRKRMTHFYWLKSQGVIFSQKTLRNAVLGTFELSDRELFLICIKAHLLQCYILRFNSNLSSSPLDLNAVALELAELKTLKQTFVNRLWAQ